MELFTSSVNYQKFTNFDGEVFSLKSAILTQTNPTILENENFFIEIENKECQVLIFPIQVSNVITTEDDVYNEEYLATLRKVFKTAQSFNIKFLFSPQIDINTDNCAELTIKSMKHTARRLKKFENIIGFVIPEFDCFKNEKVRQNFISELSEKHEHYKFVQLD